MVAHVWNAAVTTVYQATLTSLALAAAWWLLRRRSATFRHALLIVVLLTYVTPPQCTSPASVFRFIPQPAETVIALTSSARVSHDPAAWILLYWAAGSLVVAGYLVFELCRIRARTRIVAVELTADTRRTFETACRAFRMRREPVLAVAEGPAYPAARGILNTIVVLPDWVIRLPQHDIDAIVVHQLAHAARKDRAWSVFTTLVQILYWWNPLVWGLCSRARLERELAADDLVFLHHLVEPAWYTSTLVDAARRVPPRDATAAWLGLHESFHPLKHRILRALDTSTVRRRRLGIRHVLAVGLALLVTLPAPPKTPPAHDAPSRSYRYPPVAHTDPALPSRSRPVLALHNPPKMAKIITSGSLRDNGPSTVLEVPTNQSRGAGNLREMSRGAAQSRDPSKVATGAGRIRPART